MYKVIGEGTYGCVHSPALQCKNSKSYGKNFVSKSLIKSDSDIEKRHMNFIKKIDPTFEYHLKMDEECPIEMNKQSNQALHKCNMFKDDNQDLSKVKLLIMENGGMHLELYSKSIRSKSQAMVFWIKIQKTIKAVRLYLDNGIIHNDLKAQNILFNPETKKMAIIDFGLMHSKNKKENASKNYKLFQVNNIFNLTENKETIFINQTHWSWPLENEFIEKNKFIKFIEKTPFNKHQKNIEDIVKKIEYIYGLTDSNKVNTILDNNKNLDTYYTLISEIIIGTDYSIYDIFEDYLNNIYSIQKEYKSTTNKSKYYDDFLNIHLNTMDIYGLGIAFITSLKYQQKVLPNTMTKELYELFYRMITPIIKNRIQINDLLESYENLVNKYIKEYNLAFINNNLVYLPENKGLLKRTKRNTLSKAKVRVIRNKTLRQ